VRVFTEEQARGGVSLEAQEERLLNYCNMTRGGGDPGGRPFRGQAFGGLAGGRKVA